MNEKQSWADRKIPFQKKILFGFLACVLFYGFIELAFFALKPVFFRTAVLEGSIDSKKKIVMPEKIVSQTADSILVNIRHSGVAIPDYELLFRVAPNPDGRSMSGHQGVNRYGFRGTLFEELDHDSDNIRVLILGDSCGFGWRISRIEDTFPYILEKDLSQKLASSGIHVDRINLSQPGYSTTQLLVLLNKWIDVVKPHFIIAYFGWNDIWKSPLFTDREMMAMMQKLKKNDHEKLSVFRRLLAHSNVYRAIEYGLANTLVTGPSHSGSEEDRRRVSLREMEENYRDLVELSQKYSSKLIIIPPPFRDPERSYPFLEGILAYNERVQHLIGENAVFVPLPAMQYNVKGASKYFVSDRFHPNEQGAHYIAEQLADIMTPMVVETD